MAMRMNNRAGMVRLGLFGGVALAALTAAAHGQGATPAPASSGTVLEEIIVTGVRAAIQSSIEQKREASVVSDVLSSDDIGDIPALSVGEAIENITGAATHREKGGASEIAVRGLGPFLGATTFNGREASNGSGDRSVNFSMFPSELINGIAIYKSQQANFVEGGVSGIIDMQTMKPLTFGKQRIQVEGRGIYQSYDKRLEDKNGLGWRGTGTYVDQYDFGNAGELGIAFGVQKGKSNNPEELYTASSTWVACNANLTSAATANCPEVTPASYASGATPAGTPFYLATGSRTFAQITEHDDREAYMGSIQWRPRDWLDVNLDYQNSVYKFWEDRQQLNFSETLRGITNRTIDARGNLLAYSGNSTLESTPMERYQIEKYDGGGINVAVSLTDNLSIAADYGWSDTYRSRLDREVRMRSNATDINGAAIAGVTGGQRVPYTYDATSGWLPTIGVGGGYDVNRHANFSAAARVRRTEQIRWDQIDAGKLDATYTLNDGPITAVKVGGRYSEHLFRDVPQDRKEYNITDAAANATANRACQIAFPQKDFMKDAKGTPISSWAAFDASCLMTSLIGSADPGRNADMRAIGNRDMVEKATAFYGMADYALDLGDVPVSGNFGLRHVHTEVNSIGLRGGFNVLTNPDGSIRLVSNGQFESLTFKGNNDAWLPSFNAAFDLHDDFRVRLGLFRAMSRPDPEDLGAGRTFTLESGTSFGSVEQAIRSITAAGNPAIKPLLSWNADLSFEYYLNRDSLFSAAVYYKRFQGGFTNSVVNEQYNVGGRDITVPVILTETSDTKSRIYGLELSGSYRFSDLPYPFDGLGMKASYNYANSNYENEDLRLGDQYDPVTGRTIPGIIDPVNIFGLSKHVVSGSVYYELGPVELQGIYKYRSPYFQQFVGAAAQNRIVRGAGVVDFRATWRVDDHLSLSFEGSNINNAERVEDMPITGGVREVHLYGSRYYLGARYRF